MGSGSGAQLGGRDAGGASLMRRLVLVCLFVPTSMAAWAPGISAQNGGLPKAPQAKSGGLEFSVEGAIMGDSFGAPLNFDTVHRPGR